MTTRDYLDYGKLVDDAMHYVVQQAMRLVAQHGLPGEHHFFVSFETNYPGVMMSDELRKRYAEEMTIVLQHQFWNLEVEEDRFSVVLSFDGAKQNLTVPFQALLSFADPGARFGLQFQRTPKVREGLAKDPLPRAAAGQDTGKRSPRKGAEVPIAATGTAGNVVALDNFRKK